MDFICSALHLEAAGIELCCMCLVCVVRNQAVYSIQVCLAQITRFQLTCTWLGKTFIPSAVVDF